MTGYGAPTGHGLERSQFLQPASKAAIQRGNALDEQEIGGEEGARVPIQHTQVAIRMGEAVRGQGEHAAAEVDFGVVLNEHGRRDDSASAVLP